MIRIFVLMTLAIIGNASANVVLFVSAPANLTAVQIASTSSLPNTFMTSGYASQGDPGTGCIYSTVGATAGGPGAVTGGNSSLYNLVLPGGVANAGCFGAVCNGSSNDSPAFQGAFNAVGTGPDGAVEIPASTSGCLLSSTVTFTTLNNGKVLIFGSGPNSILKVAATGGGVQIAGSCGHAYEQVFFKDFTIEYAASSPSAYGIYLNGTAVYGLDNVNVIGANSANTFTYGIEGAGAQQGYINGGLSNYNLTGIYLGDCAYSGGGDVSSNGVEIHGRSFNDQTVAVDLEGGAGDVSIHNNHITNSATGIINNQTNNYGGSVANHIDENHFELNATYSLDAQSGAITAHGDSFLGLVHMSGTASNAYIKECLLLGNIVIDSGALVRLFDNQFSSTTNSYSASSSAHVLLRNNTGSGNPVSFTVANLYACTSANKGEKEYVSDATQTLTAGIGAIVAGTSSNFVPVGCDGSNWRIGG